MGDEALESWKGREVVRSAGTSRRRASVTLAELVSVTGHR